MIAGLVEVVVAEDNVGGLGEGNCAVAAGCLPVLLLLLRISLYLLFYLLLLLLCVCRLATPHAAAVGGVHGRGTANGAVEPRPVPSQGRGRGTASVRRRHRKARAVPQLRGEHGRVAVQ